MSDRPELKLEDRLLSFPSPFLRRDAANPRSGAANPRSGAAAPQVFLRQPRKSLNGLRWLGLVVSDPPTQGEMQPLVNKVDELILALRN